MLQRTRVRGRHWIVASLAAATLAAAATPAAADIGHRDQAFTSGSVAKPSGEKPQSKLWYAHGSWWGSLFHPSADPASDEYRVHRFDPLTDTWVDTGTQLDERNSSHADTLWDGTYLYVASAAAGSETNDDILVMRLRYDVGTGAWVRDASYEHHVPADGPIEAVVLDEESTGRLWLAFTQGNAVRVAHTGSGGAWGASFTLPGSIAGAANLHPDDIAAVVAYDGHVGVMWSNQADQAMYFATHVNGAADTAWAQETALGPGGLAADDHINLKSIQGTGGRVLAVVKTSKGDAATADPLDPQVVLLDRAASGAWTPRTFGTVADDHTRPIVLTDRLTGRLYVLATSPTSPNGAQTIYMKTTSLASPSFAAGAGTAFMGAPGFDVNDASSTKQDLGALPNGLVIAGDATHYWHNTIDLAHPGPTVTPTPTVRKRPVLSSLAIRPRRFRVAGRAPRGARVSYVLSDAARVRLTVERAARGRRVGGACVRPSRGNRGRRACTRFVRVPGALRRRARSGANRTAFSGRIGGRRLRPGRYRLAALAANASGTSATRRARFRVVRAAGAR
jgi:hypothetical protein